MCSFLAGRTLIAKINNAEPNLVSTLAKLSSIQGTQIRISKTVLNVLYKLTRFKRFVFGCTDGDQYKTILTLTTPTENVVNMLKYFIGESNVLPNSCETIKRGVLNCEEMDGKKWSTEGIDFESRIYNQDVRYASDLTKRYSVEDHKYGCYNHIGEYKSTDTYSIWVI